MYVRTYKNCKTGEVIRGMLQGNGGTTVPLEEWYMINTETVVMTKTGACISMYIVERFGAGVPFYVLYMNFLGTGKIYRRKGQKTRLADLKEISTKWFQAIEGGASVDLTREWIPFCR